MGEVGLVEQDVRPGQADASGDTAGALFLFGLQAFPDGRRGVGADAGGTVVEQRPHVPDVDRPEGAAVASPRFARHGLEALSSPRHLRLEVADVLSKGQLGVKFDSKEGRVLGGGDGLAVEGQSWQYSASALCRV